MSRTKKLALCVATLLAAALTLPAGEAVAQCSGGRGGSPGSSAAGGFASTGSPQNFNPIDYQRLLAMRQMYLQNQQFIAMRQQAYQQQMQQQYQQREELLAARKARALQKRAARAERIAALKASRDAEQLVVDLAKDPPRES